MCCMCRCREIRRQYIVLLERTVFRHHRSPDGEGDGCEGNGMGEVGGGHIKDVFKAEGGG